MKEKPTSIIKAETARKFVPRDPSEKYINNKERFRNHVEILVRKCIDALADQANYNPINIGEAVVSGIVINHDGENTAELQAAMKTVEYLIKGSIPNLAFQQQILRYVQPIIRPLQDEQTGDARTDKHVLIIPLPFAAPPEVAVATMKSLMGPMQRNLRQAVFGSEGRTH